jgi:hypothetical protein
MGDSSGYLVEKVAHLQIGHRLRIDCSDLEVFIDARLWERHCNECL